MENESNVSVIESEGVESGTAKETDTTEKLFTQEQVNEIIKKRLKNQKDVETSLHEMQTQTAELASRESRLDCREYLMEKGYPVELLDIIDTSDVKAFKNKADKASGVFESRHRSQVVAPLASTESVMHGSIDSAFENKKHTPKQYPPR